MKKKLDREQSTVLQGGYLKAIKHSYKKYLENNPEETDKSILKDINYFLLNKSDNLKNIAILVHQVFEVLLIEKVIPSFFKSLTIDKLELLIHDILITDNDDFIIQINYLKKQKSSEKAINIYLIQKIINFLIFWNIFAKNIYINHYFKNLVFFIFFVLVLWFISTYFILKYFMKYLI